MAEQESHRVPATIDEPVPIMFWTPMELVMAIAGLGLGVILHMMTLGMLVAGLVLWGSKKLKRGAKRGAVQHRAWRAGLEVDPALKRWFPASWQNDFLE